MYAEGPCPCRLRAPCLTGISTFLQGRRLTLGTSPSTSAGAGAAWGPAQLLPTSGACKAPLTLQCNHLLTSPAQRPWPPMRGPRCPARSLPCSPLLQTCFSISFPHRYDLHYDPEKDYAHKQLQLHPHLAEATASLASLASAGAWREGTHSLAGRPGRGCFQASRCQHHAPAPAPPVALQRRHGAQTGRGRQLVGCRRRRRSAAVCGAREDTLSTAEPTWHLHTYKQRSICLLYDVSSVMAAAPQELGGERDDAAAAGWRAAAGGSGATAHMHGRPRGVQATMPLPPNRSIPPDNARSPVPGRSHLAPPDRSVQADQSSVSHIKARPHARRDPPKTAAAPPGVPAVPRAHVRCRSAPGASKTARRRSSRRITAAGQAGRERQAGRRRRRRRRAAQRRVRPSLARV